MGSVQVGKVLELANQPVLKNCQSTQTITKGFSFGNQEIHNNIVPLYHTYKDMGLSGLQELKNLDYSEKYTSQDVIEAFEKYSVIEKKAISYATENHLSYNDPKVLKHILGDPDNAAMLKASSIDFIKHEQIIVDSMYSKSYFPNGKTVGEVIQDTCYIEKIVANELELSGAKILDQYFPTDEYAFTIYDDRIDYFTIVFDEFFNVLEQSDGFEQLKAQRDQLISNLDMDFIAYGEHFQDENDMDELMEVASTEQLESNQSEVFDPLGIFGPSANKMVFDPLGIFGPAKKGMPTTCNIIKSVPQNAIIDIQDILTDLVEIPQESHIIDLSYHDNTYNPLSSFDLHEIGQSLVL